MGILDRTTLLAFGAIVVLGGVNGTAIRIGSAELAPFWAAALRFAGASLVFFVIVMVRRVPLPRGRELVGSLLYGLLGLGASYALVYWGLVEAPAGLAQVILALVPLLTLLLAVTQRLERYRLQSVAGSLLAVGGVALVFGERLGANVPLPSMLAILAAAFAIAQANVILKRLPHSHPLSFNAVAMGIGAVLLLAASVIAGEQRALPVQLPTLLGMAYLILIGSVVVFTLYLFVISRWTASSTSYAMLLMPLVAVLVAWVVLGEPITFALLVGGAFVVAGVYIGAFAPSIARPLPGLLRHVEPPAAGAPAVAAAAPVAAPTAGPPTLATPNCP